MSADKEEEARLWYTEYLREHEEMNEKLIKMVLRYLDAEREDYSSIKVVHSYGDYTEIELVKNGKRIRANLYRARGFAALDHDVYSINFVDPAKYE